MRSVNGPVLVLDPDFSRYAEHAENALIPLLKVELAVRGDSFPEAEIIAAASDARLAMFSTVGNPTGYTIPDDFLVTLRRLHPDLVICLDDCYGAFLGKTCHEWAVHTPNTVMLGSFSKIGFPGLRVGFAIGAPELVERMRKFVSPFAVAGPSLAAAERLIGRPDFVRLIEANVERQQQARDFLSSELTRQNFEIARPTGNWILARLGDGAKRLAEELGRRNVLVHASSHPRLRQWLRISTPNLQAVQQFVVTFGDILESAVILRDGLFRFNIDHLNPRRWNEASFVVRIGTEVLGVDHVAIVLGSAAAYEELVADLVSHGGVILEGPGIWPDDFCEHLEHVSPDLSMRFATVKLESGGLLVISAPVAAGDQLDRWRAARGGDAVHHVAIHTDSLTSLAETLTAQGWKPMSEEPVSDGVLEQWFLRNEEGQILELIARSSEGSATFSCTNIGKRRRIEVRRSAADSAHEPA